LGFLQFSLNHAGTEASGAKGDDHIIDAVDPALYLPDNLWLWI